MGERKSKFTYCVRAIGLGAFLGLWAAGEAGAQTLNSSPSPAFSPTATFTSNTTGTPTSTTTFTSTVTETSTPTWTYTQDPFAAWNIYTTPTYSPTPTETPWGYIAPPTATPTETPWGYEGSPSSTPTFMNTPTPTITGTQYPTDTFTPTWTNTPSISRGALALMPTAFSNGWDHWDGLNWDIVFAYYIGSIAEKDIHADSTSYLNPLRIWLLTNDLKYGWLEAGGDQPGLASGFLFTLLLSGGNPGETGSASQNFQLTNSNLGGFYTVMSVPVDTNNAIHFGFVEGLHDALKGIGIPTMNYGIFYRNYPAIFSVTSAAQVLPPLHPLHPIFSTRDGTPVCWVPTGSLRFGNPSRCPVTPCSSTARLTVCSLSTCPICDGTKGTPCWVISISGLPSFPRLLPIRGSRQSAVGSPQ